VPGKAIGRCWAGAGPRWGRKGKEEVGCWAAHGKIERRWRAGPALVLAHGLYKEQKYFSIFEFFYRLQIYLNSNQI
jgi:hypothetical protein